MLVLYHFELLVLGLVVCALWAISVESLWWRSHVLQPCLALTLSTAHVNDQANMLISLLCHDPPSDMKLVKKALRCSNRVDTIKLQHTFCYGARQTLAMSLGSGRL